MSFGKVFFLGSATLLAAACGGSAFSGGNDGGSGQGGSNGVAGSNGQAGKNGGGMSSAGSNGSGARPGTGGVVGTGGGPNCDVVDCAFPVCMDGAKPVTKPGECCPTCPPPQTGCQGVMCEPEEPCGPGYELSRPEGACCAGCVPKPGGVGCLELACDPDMTCPLGYVRGDLAGGCCYDCLPDPLFCNEVAECLAADRPRSCCGCPEAISRRMYDANECWSDVHAPRMLPESCYPQVTCDAVCGACPTLGKLSCGDHRCMLVGPK